MYRYETDLVFQSQKTDLCSEVIYEADLLDETVQRIEVWESGKRLPLTIDELLAVKVECENHLQQNILQFLDDANARFQDQQINDYIDSQKGK